MGFYLQEFENVDEKTRIGVDWEECACLLCGGGSWTPLVEAPDQSRDGSGLWFMVVQCHECGLCFTNPRPSAQGMQAFYPSDYAPHQMKSARIKGPHWWHRLPLVSKRPGLVRKSLPVHGLGRLLDFGCGSGSYLLRMKNQGWQVTGLDASEVVVDRLRADHGLHVFSGSLPHPALETGSFDVITMWQTLEHCHQPLDVLLAAHQLLAPGGKLIVAVPNIDSLAFRWFGSAWNALDLPRHLVHFTPESLRAMLQRAGFRTGRLAMIRRGGWLRSSARVATRHFPQQSRWFRWVQHRSVSNLASWYGYWTRQSDCLQVTATRR